MRAGSCALLLVGLLWGCNQSDFGGDPDPPSDPEGPGTPAWGDQEVACGSDADCHTGETCRDGVCQMRRCGDVESYRSLPPIGQHKTFFRDRELAVADGEVVRGYAPGGGDAGSWGAGGGVIDVAGGNFDGERPEAVAAALDGSTEIRVPASDRRMDAGFVPVAIAAGDVDRDGLDEVVALGASGQVAVCHVDTESCDDWSAGGTGLDVTVADIDGDRMAEAIFLIDRAGSHRLVAWNHDHMASGEPERIEGNPGRTLVAISAGDHDGDGRAEVVALEDGGWLDWADDRLVTYVFGTAGVTVLGTTTVDWESLDVAHADLNHDRREEVLLLREERTIETFHAAGTSLASDGTMTVSGDPRRITAVDADGDSPAGRLLDGPALVAGEVVPTVVLYMPPFYKSRSPNPPWIWLGDQTNMTEALSDTVGLDVGVTFGFEAEFPGLFEAELATTLSQQIEATHTVETEIVVGDQFFLEADPHLYGEDYAAVVLSCGCFHAYTYEMDDPEAMTGADGRQFVVLVPVGGQTTLWSTKRYNAMARALGGLPEIVVPHQVGDPTSYPSSPRRADGSAIPPEDLLFPNTPTVRVSDIGDIGWGLIRTETETNEVAATTVIDVEGSVTVVGFNVGGHAGLSWGEGYAVSVGQVAEILGAVPPIPDDPHTPEDEYETYAFSFKPHVYRQPYVDRAGNEAAYYVLNFSVAE